MRSDSSEPSPRPFRLLSPESDDGASGSVAPNLATSPRQDSSSHGAPSEASLLWQPIAFPWNANNPMGAGVTHETHSVISHEANGTGQATAVRHQPAQGPAQGKKKSYKDKGKSTTSRKHHKRRTGPLQHPVEVHPAETMTRTIMRARKYVNESALFGSALPTEGPFVATFRPDQAQTPELAIYESSYGTPQTTPPPTSSVYRSAATEKQPSRSYYRNHHDKQRDKAPSQRKQAEPSAGTSSSNSGHYAANALPPAFDYSSNPRFMNVVAPDNISPDGTVEFYTTSHHPVSSSSASMTYPQSSQSPRRADKHTSSERHRRSRRHADSSSDALSVGQVPGPSTPGGTNAIASSSQRSPAFKTTRRVVRMVTLLIHDRRGDEPMEILVEVYVPLRMDDEPAVGYWADAEEVSHELQRGPSRIDGRAKLYCMRGKYRQYIMRVTCGGAIKCHTANLLITKQRTLDIYVEDAPHDCDNDCVAAHMAELAGSSPHYEREMLTPVTESMLSPASEVMILDEDDLESVSQPSSPRKRRRSTSTHSDAPNLRHSSYHANPSGPHQPSPIPQEQPMMLTQSTTQTSAAFQDSHNAHVPSPSPPQAGASHENSQFLPTPSSSQSSPSEEQLYESSRSSSSSASDPLPPNKVRRLDGSRDVSPAQNVSFPMSHSRAVQEELQAAPAAALAAQPPALATPPPAPANPFLRSSFARFATSLDVSNTQTRMSGDPFPKTSTLPSAGLNPISPASEQDNAVSMHLRSLILKDPAWEKFRIGRQHNLTMSQQMQQYEYVKSMFDKYVSKYTSVDLKGAPGVQITKSHVMRAFNLPDKWGEEGMEMLSLTALYGPGGKRYEDANIIAMMEERHPIATKMQVEKFLKLLRETHSRWTVEHPDLLQ